MNGIALTRGTIVQVYGETSWTDRQGIVIDVNSDLDGPEFPVAVYFGREVDASRFNSFQTRTWDMDHLASCPAALLVGIMRPEDCPRIVCLRPGELAYRPEWGTEMLCDRYFRQRRGHYTIKDPFIPGAHACWVRGCDRVATELVLMNIWGMITPFYGCTACYAKWHRLRCDSTPEFKNPLPKAHTA